jgi:cobalt/nickel transport system ATP-binding protein
MELVPIFDLAEVSYSYPESVALDGVSLSVFPGERVAVLGANGSGKSTLLRVLAGLCFPERGKVVFQNQVLNAECLADESFSADFHQRVGIVFQNPDVQLFNATVFDEVAFGPLQMGWPKEEIIERTHATLHDMGIFHLKDRTPHRLSGGEKKRVALASVLVFNPDVLLMDEPTAALDPKSQGRMIDFLFDCAGKKTVVTTTHSLEIIEDIADRCIVLENGHVAASGSPAEVLNDVALLERTDMVYKHKHRHQSGVVHSHPCFSHEHTHATPDDRIA